MMTAMARRIAMFCWSVLFSSFFCFVLLLYLIDYLFFPPLLAGHSCRLWLFMPTTLATSRSFNSSNGTCIAMSLSSFSSPSSDDDDELNENTSGSSAALGLFFCFGGLLSPFASPVHLQVFLEHGVNPLRCQMDSI